MMEARVHLIQWENDIKSSSFHKLFVKAKHIHGKLYTVPNLKNQDELLNEIEFKLDSMDPISLNSPTGSPTSSLSSTASTSYAMKIQFLLLLNFHLILVFREMCDHFGQTHLTRDVLGNRLWAALIHPHNNGYHLTHHLMPSVPYYRLPAAQRLFSSLPIYGTRGRALSSYLRGKASVVAGWQTGSQA